MKTNTVLITGVAGFIGSSLAFKLLAKGFRVVGIDNFTDNYPKLFKSENLARIKGSQFKFFEADVLNKDSISHIIQATQPNAVVHLAALTGVRASLKKPSLFHQINVIGTEVMYGAAVKNGVTLFIFSSSSSVYGKGGNGAFYESTTLKPVSPYATSKVQAEKKLKYLQKKFKLPVTILRLFSVYGPYGRPDMAPYIFTEAALNKKTVTIYGYGEAARDFTYISDVTRAFEQALSKTFSIETINIGCTVPVRINDLLNLTQEYTKKKLNKTYTSQITEESFVTHADITKAKLLLKWQPQVKFTQGFKKFVDWYKKNRV